MSPTKPPTVRQLEVLQSIDTLTGRLGIPPTIRELCDHQGVGMNCVCGHLDGLTARALVERPPGRVRSLRLTERGFTELARFRGRQPLGAAAWAGLVDALYQLAQSHDASPGELLRACRLAMRLSSARERARASTPPDRSSGSLPPAA